MRLPAGFCCFFLCGALFSAPQSLRPDVSLRRVVETGSGGSPIRLARDPAGGALYYLRQNGSIYRIQAPDGPAPSTVRVHTAADTGVNRPLGFAFGPEGNLYLTGNEAQDAYTVATVRRGVCAAAGSDARTWTTVARTERYPRSGVFDHLVNGLAVSFDGQHLYVNSGSRTDHGEEQSRE